MKQAITIALVLLCVTASGCAMMEKNHDRLASVLNPKKIHTAASDSDAASRAEEIPIDDYYNALQLARTKYTATDILKSNSSLIENYVNEGIGLADAYCRRWFQKLDDMNRMLAFQTKNVNIISQMGTTLLGIGHASASWVTAYGASNTAFAGVSENVSGAFLVAPTSARVQEHVDTLMSSEATALRAKSSTLTFKEAYSELERYADYCTYSRAKQIVDAALSITTTNLNNTTKQPETTQKTK